jgi:phosphoserine aminotransferase
MIFFVQNKNNSLPMISFYPGPSKVYPQVEHYLADAYHSGILSANHRSEGFMKMLASTIEALKGKLGIPADYEVYFVSSATECWEIIAQSLVSESGFHIYNGAFGAKWMEYAQKLKKASAGVAFGHNDIPDASLVPEANQHDLICVTHNETSNGTALPDYFLHNLRNRTDQLIAVDATSSMGGVVLPWLAADVWYASVQKCFGLPSGLGVLVVSPRAIARASRLGEDNHYNSFNFVRSNFKKFQTPYTPNTLMIYLLGRVMEQVRPIHQIATDLYNRAADLYGFITTHGYKPLIATEEVRSHTVITVEAEQIRVEKIKKLAKDHGIVLGNGYGEWKDTTFRIANFPAITDDEVLMLKKFFSAASSLS